LCNKTGANDETKADLTAGIEAANRVLKQANSAVDKEQRREALDDLTKRVDDWKNHRVDHFGDLLLCGHFPVVTGKSDVQKEVRPHPYRTSNHPSFTLASTSTAKNIKGALRAKCKALVSRSEVIPEDAILELPPRRPRCDPQWDLQSALKYHDTLADERHSDEYDDMKKFLANMVFHYEGKNPGGGDNFLAKQYADMMGLDCPEFAQYTIYLFERILLCCKELNPNKSKDKLMGQKDKKDKKDKVRNREPNKNAKLQLKGRIFMTNVTEVLSLAKQGMYPF